MSNHKLIFLLKLCIGNASLGHGCSKIFYCCGGDKGTAPNPPQPQGVVSSNSSVFPEISDDAVCYSQNQPIYEIDAIKLAFNRDGTSKPPSKFSAFRTVADRYAIALDEHGTASQFDKVSKNISPTEFFIQEGKLKEQLREWKGFKKGSEFACIILPSSAVVDLYNTTLTLQPGSLGDVPKYGTGSDTGWVYQAQLSNQLQSTQSKKAIYISRVGDVFCFLWNEYIKQVFYVRINITPENLKNAFANVFVAEGTADSLKLGDNCFALNKNSSGSLFQIQGGAAPGANPDTYIIDGHTLSGETLCYGYQHENDFGAPARELDPALSAIWNQDATHKRPITLKDFKSNPARYNKAVIMIDGKVQVIDQHNIVVDLSYNPLSNSYYCDDLPDANAVKKGEQKVCIILPENAEIGCLFELGQAVSVSFSEEKPLLNAPKYSGTGTGYAPIAALKNTSKKAVLFNRSGMGELCMWDPVFEKIFVTGSYLRRNTGGRIETQDLFKGIKVDNAVKLNGQIFNGDRDTFETGVGILPNSTMVCVCKVAYEVYFVLHKDPNGPLFAENESDALEFNGPNKEDIRKEIENQADPSAGFGPIWSQGSELFPEISGDAFCYSQNQLIYETDAIKLAFNQNATSKPPSKFSDFRTSEDQYAIALNQNGVVCNFYKGSNNSIENTSYLTKEKLCPKLQRVDKLTKEESFACIILPSSAVVDLYNKRLRLQPGSLRDVPKYGAGSDTGWVYDSSLFDFLKDNPNKKAISITEFGNVFCFLWHQHFNQIFFLYLQTEDLKASFGNVFVDINAADSLKLGDNYFALNNDPNGPLFQIQDGAGPASSRSDASRTQLNANGIQDQECIDAIQRYNESHDTLNDVCDRLSSYAVELAQKKQDGDGILKALEGLTRKYDAPGDPKHEFVQEFINKIREAEGLQDKVSGGAEVYVAGSRHAKPGKDQFIGSYKLDYEGHNLKDLDIQREIESYKSAFNACLSQYESETDPETKMNKALSHLVGCLNSYAFSKLNNKDLNEYVPDAYLQAIEFYLRILHEPDLDAIKVKMLLQFLEQYEKFVSFMEEIRTTLTINLYEALSLDEMTSEQKVQLRELNVVLYNDLYTLRHRDFPNELIPMLKEWDNRRERTLKRIDEQATKDTKLSGKPILLSFLKYEMERVEDIFLTQEQLVSPQKESLVKKLDFQKRLWTIQQVDEYEKGIIKEWFKIRFDHSSNSQSGRSASSR